MTLRMFRRAVVFAAPLALVFVAACTIWNGATLPTASSSDDASARDASEAPASGYADEVLDAGPIAYWQFSELAAGGSRLVHDVSNHGHDCTASAGITTVDGPFAGTSATRIGNGDGIDCKGDAAFGFPLLAPFTFEAFALLDGDGALGEEQFRFLFDRMSGGTPSTRLGYYAFFYRRANEQEWRLGLERWRGDSREDGAYATSASELVSGKWVHWAFTQSDGTLTIYVNGSARGQVTTVSVDAPSGVALVLGRNQTGSCCALVGSIAEMAVYDRALDAETVKRHYDAAFPNGR